MKRFWTEATARPGPEGWTVRLDGWEVRTPKRAVLAIPTAALAEAVRAEWAGVGEVLDPRALPYTGLANAAVDQAAPDPAAFAAPLARYAQGDLLCYRADGPDALVRRQAAAWDPWLAWASRRYDCRFVVTAGVVYAPQPPDTLRKLAAALEAQDAFRLAALNPLVTIGGSLVIALALVEGAIDEDEAWAAVLLDELWQAEQWGEDAEALSARAARRRDWAAATRFFDLLGG